MKINSKVILFCLCACLIRPPGLQARYAAARVSLDGIDYTVLNENSSAVRAELLLFHQIFKQMSFKLYERFNIKRPSSFRVTLCLGAWIFRDSTGKGAFTAGLYDPLQQLFFFQRPSALRKKNMLERTISHELLHSIIDHARRAVSRQKTAGADRLFLEESFCESLYPTIFKDTHPYKHIIRQCRSYVAFKKRLGKYLKHGSIKQTKVAYRSLQIWGNHVLRELKEQQFFHIVTRRKTDQVLHPLYVRFRNRILSQ